MVGGDIRRWGFARSVIGEPLRAALRHGNQALVTFAAAYASAQFSMQHGVFPVWVAVPLAIGFEWTYLRGLATADQTTADGWVLALNWIAMLSSAAFGILYILGMYGVIPERPTGIWAIGLAIAHVVPVTLLLFAASMVSRQHASEHRAARQDAERQRQQLEHEAAAERQRQQLEHEAKQRDMELWRTAQVYKQELKASAPVSAPVHGQAPPADDSAAGQDVQAVRDKAANILRTEPGLSVSELARRLGVSRQYLYRHSIVQKKEG
jgi:AraC-like DNA-binding protein